MKCTTSRLNQLLEICEAYLIKTHRQQLAAKPKPTKWSKKQILGHLIDSALYNLRRFNEIQIKPKPYKIIDYEQEELVFVNDYQSADHKNLTKLWVSLNKQIIHVIDQQTEKTLKIEAKLPNQKTTSFLFLINNYLEHLEHHVKQIVEA